MNIIVFMLYVVACLFGISKAADNIQCTNSTTCGAGKVCQNAFCKIKDGGDCTINESPTTTSPASTAKPSAPSGVQSGGGINGSSTNTSGAIKSSNVTNTVTQAPKGPQDGSNLTSANGTSVRRKRQADTQASSSKECVQNALCISSAKLTCQCNDGYESKQGLCQEKSSAQSLQMRIPTTLIATVLVLVNFIN